MDTDGKDTLGRLMEISRARRDLLNEDQFTKAPIQVGMELVVEFRFGKVGVKSKTSLIGYSRGEYLIIKTPKLNGKHVNYSVHKNVIVRYFLEGSAFGFSTALIRTIGSPFHLTLIEYPTTVEQVSLRDSPRVQVVIPFERDGGDPMKESIMNLSATGALLHIQGQVQLEDVIPISFALPNGQEIREMPCTVRRVDLSNDRALAGVQFDKNHPHFERVVSYIEIVLETLGAFKDSMTSG